MRKETKKIQLLKQEKKIDIWVFIIPIFLSIFGLLMIFEASNVAAFRDFADKYHFVKDQFVSLVIGLTALVATSFIPYKKYYTFSVPIFFISILFLILVLIPGVGIQALGAKRWISIAGFSFQPSELAKLAAILYLSSWFTSKERKRFLAFLLLLGFFVGLIVYQPDLGTAIIIGLIFIMMYFFSNASLWHFFLLVPLSIVAVSALAIFSPYRLARLTTFFNPNFDPLGASYHIRQILIAFGSGGLWGVGLGASRQKYQFLPEATTDSIFAIIGEEFGFIGAAIFIALFIILLHRVYKIAKSAKDKQGFLIASGILVLFASQAAINLGSMVAILPLTGIPLPFVSYGGSSLIIFLSCVGILVNISKTSISRS